MRTMSAVRTITRPPSLLWEVKCVSVTHPGSHASGGKPGDVVLKVDASDPDHVHLVCRIVQGAGKKNKTTWFEWVCFVFYIPKESREVNLDYFWSLTFDLCFRTLYTKEGIYLNVLLHQQGHT